MQKSRRLLLAATVIAAAAGFAAVRTADSPEVTAIPTPRPTLPVPDSAPYATAIRMAVDHNNGVAGKPPKVVYVRDHLCETAASSDGRGPCANPIPPALRTDLAQALAPYAPVEFVALDARLTDEHFTVKNHGVSITLGPITHTPKTAKIPLSLHINGLNALGAIITLHRNATSWTCPGNDPRRCLAMTWIA
ncbi:hypothetical protein GCM10027589_40370 [Actinocorallia lasiicapitis]